MESFEFAREKMVRDQIQRRGVKDLQVLEVMRSVPRHLFVTKDDQTLAYQDHPLPIGYDQTISQPYIVALMTEQLQLKPEEIVLEIGTGSGYQAAILSRLVKHVYSIERIQPLANQAKTVLKNLAYDNVDIFCKDGSLGLQEFAPYDAILITAAAPAIPQPLLDQLKPEGRILLPVGSSGQQILLRIKKMPDGSLISDELIPVVFVPLRGFFGWHEDDWHR